MHLPHLLLACLHVPFGVLEGKANKGQGLNDPNGKTKRERAWERKDLKISQQALTAKLTTSKTFPSQQRLNQNPIPQAYELEEQLCDYD